MEYNGSSSEAQHLCVLVHGLWGNPNHLRNVAKALRGKHGRDQIHILVAERNSGSFTYDGIELGGERVCQEIEEEVEKLAKTGQQFTRISIVGYSLGGLIGRYAIGLLDGKDFFKKIIPVNFTTFATPHLGVRTPLRGWHSQVFNAMGARTLSASGRQLFTVDEFRETGRPLLEILADPESIFIKALRKFQRRSLYANIINDRSAPYYTTSISQHDPFTDLDKVVLNYIPGYDRVILDRKDPWVPLDLTGKATTLCETVQTTIDRIPFFLALAVFLPIGIVAFLLNSGIQSLRSSRRIKLHERGLAGIQPGNYRLPLITGMRGVVEDAYENLSSSQHNEYLVAPEEANLQQPSLKLSRSNMQVSDEQLGKSKRPLHPIPILALAPFQFKMIQALDNVGWRKFLVHIHEVRHSHAAIIVRKDKPSFHEGKVVLRHWLDEEFIL